MAYVINERCIDELDGSCVQSCPVDCIYTGPRKRYINPDECIDCGACLPECPVDAIIAPDELPDPVWVADNAAFFTVALPGRETALGSPGGAEPTGPVAADTPLVAGWAPPPARPTSRPMPPPARPTGRPMPPPARPTGRPS